MALRHSVNIMHSKGRTKKLKNQRRVSSASLRFSKAFSSGSASLCRFLNVGSAEVWYVRRLPLIVHLTCVMSLDEDLKLQCPCSVMPMPYSTRNEKIAWTAAMNVEPASTNAISAWCVRMRNAPQRKSPGNFKIRRTKNMKPVAP